jgi:hypothetical protein
VIQVAFLRIARVVKWQTRTFEGRMPKGVGVQVPPRAEMPAFVVVFEELTFYDGNAERRTPNAERYAGGMTAILIPFRAQACSSTFGQSSSANSSVTISLTLILPLSR